MGDRIAKHRHLHPGTSAGDDDGVTTEEWLNDRRLQPIKRHKIGGFRGRALSADSYVVSTSKTTEWRHLAVPGHFAEATKSEGFSKGPSNRNDKGEK